MLDELSEHGEVLGVFGNDDGSDLRSRLPGIAHRVRWRSRSPTSATATVLAGYQTAGTRGAALLNGAQTLRIFCRDVPIRAEAVRLDDVDA